MNGADYCSPLFSFGTLQFFHSCVIFFKIGRSLHYNIDRTGCIVWLREFIEVVYIYLQCNGFCLDRSIPAKRKIVFGEQ